MLRETYAALPQASLSGQHCTVADASGSRRRVTLDSPALEVMTDLARIPAATIGPDTPLVEAHRAMILRGVRLLLVCAAQGAVQGVVSAADLLGERPVRVARARGAMPRDLCVADVMTAMDRVEAVNMDDVVRAEVGHVVATLRRSGRQHALVIERDEEGRGRIRGIFSSSQIARQLGEAPPPSTEIPRNFAEIEAAIAA